MNSFVFEKNRSAEGSEAENEDFLGSIFPWWPWPSEEADEEEANIEDRTAFTPKDLRKGARDITKIYALVLHMMAFSRGNEAKRYDTVNSHFAITPDGKIIQLHPLEQLLWSSNGFNNRSVAVEFAGNFPNTKGKCWQPQNYGCHQVTQAQIDAGRTLVKYLIKKIGLTHVLAHRQSSGSRENDPGPDIWYGVGQWAVDNLGMKDGGPGFKIDSGNPIPDEWRNWGNLKTGRDKEFETQEWEQEDESIWGTLKSYVGSSLEDLMLRSAIRGGNTDPTSLTNLVFFRRHPERNNRPLSKSEPNFQQLSSEWISIRDSVVKPALSGSGAPAQPSAPTTGTPDIVSVRGIKVAREIASNLDSLLAAAEADGIRLGGGGYRSRDEQIALRKAHCGTTEYDIYKKPSSQCSPPTAPPGSSMHERGLAIDFTYNGDGIKSHDNPGYRWLAANAARFGLKNLASEPWHWSVNGK